MSNPDSDRNLLIGILALQLSLVTEQQLLDAMKRWAFDKSQLLEDILFVQKSINDQVRLLLKGLLATDRPLGKKTDSHLESLSTVAAAIQKLSELSDAELDESVADFLLGTHVHNPSVDDPTRPFNQPKRTERFRIIRPLATGGLGQVSVAEDLELHREVALKEIKPKYLHNGESQARFLVEAEVTGRLEHPGIVPVYSLGSTKEGGPFYAMQLIRGVSLADAIRKLHAKDSKLDVHEKQLELRKHTLRLVSVCQAMQYAHTKGVLHRDIKPQNIMLGKFGETFVVDWGLARVNNKDAASLKVTSDESILIPSSGSGSSATVQGTMIGTPDYMSPEQASGRLNELGPASDVFSLGATLYCILTGRPPTSNQEHIEQKQLDYGNFRKPSQLNRHVPQALDAICMKALATEISDRYKSANELMEDLEAWLADEHVSAYVEPWVDRVRRKVRRHRTLAATFVGIVLTTLVALATILIVIGYHNRALNRVNIDLTEARDEAVENLMLARRTMTEQLRTAEELLSQNSLSPAKNAALRLRLTAGVVEGYQRWSERYPDDLQLANEYAYTARVQGNLSRSVSNFKEARRLLAASLTVQRKTPAEQKTAEENLAFVLTLIDSSEIDMLEGRLFEALATTDEALSALKSAEKVDPDISKFSKASATLHFQRAGVLFEIARHDDALKEVKQAQVTLEKVLEDTAATNQFRYLYLLSLIKEFRIEDARGKPKMAIQLADAAVAKSRALRAENQASHNESMREFHYALITSLAYAARFRLDNNIEKDKVSGILLEAEALVNSEVNALPSATFLERQCQIKGLVGQLNRHEGKLDDSTSALENAINDADGLIKRLELVDFLVLKAELQYQLALTFRANGKPDKATQMLEAVRTTFSSILKKSPKSPRIQAILVQLEVLP